MYIYTYMCVYICNHANNVPSQLSTQWLGGNLCSWADDVHLHITGTYELKSAQQAKEGGQCKQP